jgi:pyruvate dehydrogenase E2 component (dihydrolipoamide acetyltransferase)
MAVIGEEGEDITSLLEGGAAESGDELEPEPETESKPETETKDEPAEKAPEKAPEKAAPASESGGRILASPVARRIAEEKGISLSDIEGSGPAGRIIRKDVESFKAAAAKSASQTVSGGDARASGKSSAPAAASAAASGPSFAAPLGTSDVARGELVTLSPMRKAIAKNLSAAWQAPAFMLTRDIAMDATMAMRAQVNKQLADAKLDIKVSVNDFIIKACAKALIDVPEMNAEYRADGVLLYKNADIGFAVAIDGGLITPVIRSAESKSLSAIGAEAKALAAKARDKKLQPDEFTGSTFSISNLGMFGIDHFTAVLNPPAAGILAVGTISKVPVVNENDEIVVGQRMFVTLTCDHRAIDGAKGAEFLGRVVTYLENPLLLMA